MTDDKKRLDEIQGVYCESTIRAKYLLLQMPTKVFDDVAFLLAQIDKRDEALRKIVADCNCVGRCPCLTDKAREALGEE